MRRGPQGAPITAQVAGRPVGVIMGIGTARSTRSRSARAIIPLEALPPAERLRRLRDPEMRRQLLSEEPSERQLAPPVAGAAEHGRALGPHVS